MTVNHNKLKVSTEMPKKEKEKRKLTKGENQNLYQSIKGAKVKIKLFPKKSWMKLSPPVMLTILIWKRVFTLLLSGKKCAMMLQEKKPAMTLKWVSVNQAVQEMILMTSMFPHASPVQISAVNQPGVRCPGLGLNEHWDVRALRQRRLLLVHCLKLTSRLILAWRISRMSLCILWWKPESSLFLQRTTPKAHQCLYVNAGAPPPSWAIRNPRSLRSWGEGTLSQICVSWIRLFSSRKKIPDTVLKKKREASTMKPVLDAIEIHPTPDSVAPRGNL